MSSGDSLDTKTANFTPFSAEHPSFAHYRKYLRDPRLVNKAESIFFYRAGRRIKRTDVTKANSNNCARSLHHGKGQITTKREKIVPEICSPKCFPVCAHAKYLLRKHLLLTTKKKNVFWFFSETFCFHSKCFPVCALRKQRPLHFLNCSCANICCLWKCFSWFARQVNNVSYSFTRSRNSLGNNISATMIALFRENSTPWCGREYRLKRIIAAKRKPQRLNTKRLKIGRTRIPRTVGGNWRWADLQHQNYLIWIFFSWLHWG